MQAGDEAEDALDCLNEEGGVGIVGDYEITALERASPRARSLKGGGWSDTDVGCLGNVTSMPHWHLTLLIAKELVIIVTTEEFRH